MEIIPALCYSSLNGAMELSPGGSEMSEGGCRGWKYSTVVEWGWGGDGRSGMESGTQVEEVTGQEKAHFVHWPGRKRRQNGLEKKKFVRFGSLREFPLHGFCFLLNAAGWQLNWGFKDSKEECGLGEKG